MSNYQWISCLYFTTFESQNSVGYFFRVVNQELTVVHPLKYFHMSLGTELD